MPKFHRSFLGSRLICAIALLMGAATTPAQQTSGDLASASLEDLMNMQVVSASRTEQKLSHTASAIFVITQEDIRQSGALNIPDLLRMVPGLDVAQINSNTWAISGRGLNARWSNELLVLVDGRSVYSTSFGGVFWDVLDLPLEDIDRIEVIRGPGGSVWGANAVNGIINIITKKSSETKGALVVSGGGNVQQGFGTVQYGGDLGTKTQYRAYTKYFNEDHFPDADDPAANGGDGWHTLRGGFRADTAFSPKDSLMIEGDLYSIRETVPTVILPSITSPGFVPIDLPQNLSGGFLQGVWQHTYSPESNSLLEISYDHDQRNDQIGDGRGILDVNFQQQYTGWSRQNLVWYVGYRRASSYAPGSLILAFVPPRLVTNLYSGAVQDEISLIPDRLSLTAGVRIEHNYYTGFNAMPSVRIAWSPTDRQTVWAAVSNAVRSPAQIDAGFRVNFGSFVEPDGTLALVSFFGNPKIADESLIAYEFGYRAMAGKRLSFDFASYYNDYDHQETTEPETPFFENTPAPPHLVLPSTLENLMHGEANGVEAYANWKVTDRWTLSPGYAFETIHMRTDPTSHDTTSASEAEGSSPTHAAQLRSHVALPGGFSWDSSAYFVGRLTDLHVPSYTRVDSQLSWQFAEKGRLRFVGQNLARDHHMEFVDSTASAGTTLMKRSAYAEISWQF